MNCAVIHKSKLCVFVNPIQKNSACFIINFDYIIASLNTQSPLIKKYFTRSCSLFLNVAWQVNIDSLIKFRN